jgi:hypothetical protein
MYQLIFFEEFHWFLHMNKEHSSFFRFPFIAEIVLTTFVRECPYGIGPTNCEYTMMYLGKTVSANPRAQEPD